MQVRWQRGKRRPRRQPSETSGAWRELPWRKLEQHVYRIQKRIYRASQRGNHRQVDKLQKLLLKSEAARLLAVRRVTQDNQGKKTAGVDGVKSVPPKERFLMVRQLHTKRWNTRKKPRPCAQGVDTQTREGREATIRHTDMSFILPLFPGDVRDSNGRQRGEPEVPAYPLCSTLPRSVVAFHSDDVSSAAASACAAAR